VRLDRWDAGGQLLTAYPMAMPPTAGSPGSPGLVVDPSSRTAVVATRDGGVSTIDLDRDVVTALALPEGVSGCSPRRLWSATEVLLACSSDRGRLVVTGLAGSASRMLGASGLTDAWPVPAQAMRAPVTSSAPRSTGSVGALVAERVQGTDGCSTATGRLEASGAVTRLGPTGEAAFLVAKSVVGGVLYLGGTGCWSDGSQLVAYDLATGRQTVLAGETAGRRTVRQAIVLPE
jgi:hypothetical protein